MRAEAVKILVSESGGFSTEAAERLRRVGELILTDFNRHDLLSGIKDVDVLWVRLRHSIDAEVISNAPNLKIIVTATTGLNHIDLEETARRGIRILSLGGENAFLQDVRATAEHTLALALALLRRLPQAVAHVLDGGWNRDLFRGRELYQKTVGVIGYGRLGRIVARYLKAFDARILVTDPKSDLASLDPCTTRVPLGVLLKNADIITLHVPLNENTRGFFGADEFSAMKSGAFFVNTSRGELIDESALLAALRSSWLGGAALDVLESERAEGMKNRALVEYARKHENLIITPHLGGCTVESMEKTELFLAEKLCAEFLLNDAIAISRPSS